MEKRVPFTAALFVASAFILFYTILLPVKVQIIIEGSVVQIVQIPALYDLSGTIVIATTAFVMGASAMYMLVSPSRRPVLASPTLDQARLERWKESFDSLTDRDEQKLYQLIMEEGGVIFQGKLAEKSGFPKGKVSLVLDRLEARGLLERKRHGMSNIVVLR